MTLLLTMILKRMSKEGKWVLIVNDEAKWLCGSGWTNKEAGAYIMDKVMEGEDTDGYFA